MKCSKRILTFLLAITLIVGSVQITFADDSFNIVSMGDSTSNGYGLSDCSAYGFGDECSNDAYPVQLKNEFAKVYSKVNLANLGMAGSMQEDYYLILNPSAYQSADKLSKEHVDRYIDYYFNGDIKKANAYFTEKLAAANLITLDCNMNNFGSNVIARITAAYGLKGDYSNYPETLDDIEGVTDSIRSQCREMEKDLYSNFPALYALRKSTYVKKLLAAFECEYAEYCITLCKNIESIRSINPNASLYISGISFNIMEGAVINAAGYKIDLEQIWKRYVYYADKYVKTDCPLVNEYTYVKISDCKTFYQEAQAGIVSSTVLNKIKSSEITPGIGEINVIDRGNTTVGDLGVSDSALANVIVKSANKTVDFTSMITIITKIGDITELVSDTIKNYSKATDGAKSFMNIYMRTGLGGGVMVHPTEAGCVAKYNCFSSVINETFVDDGFVNFSLLSQSKAFTARWSLIDNATAYQLRYTTNSSMKGAMTLTYSKTSSKDKIALLISKKSYYVQMRYKYKENGKTKYSEWSPIQYIVVK